MSEDAGKTDGLCDIVPVVNGIKVSGGTGVANESISGQVEGLVGYLIANTEI
jgi:hypothetical protein